MPPHAPIFPLTEFVVLVPVARITAHRHCSDSSSSSRVFSLTASCAPLLIGCVALAMSLDLGGLATVLHNTFNSDNNVRLSAEATLAAFEQQPGSHGLMLELMALPADAVPFEVKQSASLRLKNMYASYGSIRKGDLCKISDLDRQLVQDRILEAVIRQTAPLLRVQLLEVVYHLWPSDSPSQWSTLVPNIIANLQTGMSSSPPDLLRIYGSICTLRIVLKRYQFRDPKARQPVYEIVDQTFPLLLPILQTFAGLSPAQQTEETREICRILCKIFFLSTTLSLPPLLLNDFAKCVPWFDVLIFMLEQPVPGLESIQATGDEALEKLRITPGWRIKKWVAQIFLRIYNRFGRPKMVGEDKKQSKAERAARKAWATQFEAQYTMKVLGTMMNVLKVKTQGGYVTERVVHQSLTYISTSIDSAVHYKTLKPHLPFLIQEVILQQMMLTPADLSLWHQDPHEFIRRSLDLMSEFLDARMAAIGLLNDMIAYRTRDTLQLTINTIEHVFDTYEKAEPSQRNYLLKEGAMRMFGGIKKLMLSKKEFRDGIENMMIRHVLPEFQSQHGFLRARACAVVREYWNLKWKNTDAHVAAVRSCVERLQDPELPVKMDAWSAVSEIVEHEAALEVLKPSLPLIIDAFHTLFDEIGNEAVVGVLETLVERFGEDVTPFALQLVGKLTDLYLNLQQQIMEAGDDYDDDVDEAGSTAYHCLKTIVCVLYAVSKKPELYAQLLAPCCAILDKSINETSIELYEDVLDMISVLIYQPVGGPIPEVMWKYLPQITGSFFTFAGDFLNCMLPVFDTFLSKGAALLNTPQGRPLLEAMYNVAKHILNDPDRLIDSAQACVLIESILANMRGHVDDFILPIVGMSTTRLVSIVEMEEAREAARKKKAAAKAAARKKKGAIKKGKGGAKFLSKDEEEEDEDEEVGEMAALKMGLLDNIGIACHYNPLLFCQILTAQPAEAVNRLFNIWLSYVKAMKNDFDVSKNAVLGLSSLCLIPIATLPEQWRSAMPGVLGVLLNALTEMSKLLAESGDQEQEEDEDEDQALFHDIHEDADVYHPEDGGDADSEDIDDAADGGDEDAPLDFLDDMEEAMLGTNDVDKFVSPLDDIDPFVFFAQSIQSTCTEGTHARRQRRAGRLVGNESACWIQLGHAADPRTSCSSFLLPLLQLCPPRSRASTTSGSRACTCTHTTAKSCCACRSLSLV